MAFPTIEKYYDKTRFDYRYVWNSRNTYAIHFGFYDENATHHVAAVANMNRVLADLGKISKADRVLDAGCGVGGSSLWLAQERGCSVVGINVVDSQIKDARLNAAKLGLSDKVNFELTDYCKTPFDDSSFDVVWAMQSQCHAANKADFYRETYRLLKKGGRLVVADYIRAARPLMTEGGEKTIIPNEKLLLDWLNNWAIPDIDTTEEHRKQAESAGFKNFSLQNVNPNVRRSLLNAYNHSARWHKTAQVLSRMGIVSPVQVGNVFATICQYKAWEQNLWFYGLISAEK
jgi:tocopherol O-methyltransferase